MSHKLSSCSTENSPPRTPNGYTSIEKCQVKLSLCLINQAQRIAQPFLTSALDRSELSATCPGRYIRDAQCIEGWLGPRAGLDAVEKNLLLPPGIEPQQSST
jgi:hypothetical protein